MDYVFGSTFFRKFLKHSFQNNLLEKNFLGNLKKNLKKCFLEKFIENNQNSKFFFTIFLKNFVEKIQKILLKHFEKNLVENNNI